MFKGLSKRASKVIDSIKPNINILKSNDSNSDDPKAEFEASVELFKKISTDSNEMIGLLIKFQAQLEKLSHCAIKFSEDMDKWFIDAPEESRYRAKTVLSFAKHFDALTVNFLKPRIDPHVISILLKFQEEIERLEVVQEERQKALKAMEKTSTSLKITFDKDKKHHLEEQYDEEKRLFDEKNQDFIQSVNALSQNKSENLEKPFRNLICLFSQYMMQVFTELQKFRTTYPPETFAVLNNQPNSEIQQNPYQSIPVQQNPYQSIPVQQNPSQNIPEQQNPYQSIPNQ